MTTTEHHILIAEDDARYAGRLARNLELEGYRTTVAADGEAALARLAEVSFDLLLADIKMPGLDGMQVLERIRSGEAAGVDPDLPVVVMTSINTMAAAVEALRLRANDFLTKELERDEIMHRVRAVLNQQQVQRENQLLRQRLAEQSEHGAVIAESDAMREVLAQADAIAGADATVLLLGETGVGKDLVARYLHERSARAQQPLCEVNCAALPDDNMLQSELFGHEKGAFTGADQQKRGWFELADGGTLFLDEIGDLSLESQGKLLRALETRRIERLGSTKTLEVDVRFLLATNHELTAEVDAGRFRRDLYYRINVVQLYLPPLRQRTADIVPLMTYFLERFARRYRRPLRPLPAAVQGVLTGYGWPGNVRELRNVAERLVLLGKSEPVQVQELQQAGLGRGSLAVAGELVQVPPAGAALEEIERQAIVQALEHANWVQREAARLLEISPDRMNARVKKFGLTHPSWRSQSS